MSRTAAGGVGPLLRDWRARRGRSQMDLAHDVGVSPKHLSFVETGRSRPSPELVLALAEGLAVPLRERNTLLLAAGFAPRYGEAPLDSPGMARVQASLQRLLDAHAPFPGVVLDRHCDVVLANGPAATLTGLLPADLAGPPLNMFRAGLHPDGLAAHTRNFDDWGRYLLAQLRRLVAVTGDAELAALEAEVGTYPNVVDLRARLDWASPRAEPDLLVPCELEVGSTALSMFTTLTTFGSPRDITLDELAVELFFPSDAATEEALRALAAPSG